MPQEAADAELVSFFRCTLVSLHFVNMLFPKCLRQISWQRAMQCNETRSSSLTIPAGRAKCPVVARLRATTGSRRRNSLALYMV